MVEQIKRVIKVSFNGKELLESRVFDTTDAEVAKKNGTFDPKRKYGPLTIITGEHELLPLIEKELEQMKVGEKREVKLTAKESFGERKADLVRVVPVKLFHDQKMKPVPGLVISAGNAYGKVQSISGGRVRVDFNHPLAGRDVEYEVKIEEEIIDKKARAETLFDKYYAFVPSSKKELVGEKLIVGLGKDTLKNLEKINESITRLGKDLGVEVEFKEIAEKEKAKEGNVEKEVAKEAEEKVAEEKENVLIKNEAEEERVHEQVHECHDPNCSHNHGEEEGEVIEKTQAKSINKVADELKKVTKSGTETTITRDFASTIQRPKKK